MSTGSCEDTGQQRAKSVNALFSTIAARYDLMNDLQSFGLHRAWKSRLARLARVAPGDRALDVCCGTGDISIALARWDANVVGLDFNQQMLGVAQERRQKFSSRIVVNCARSKSGAQTLNFLCGDAMRLPFPDDTFDVVTVGYGLRNLAQWETGLREMHRVARPKGRLLVLDFGKPDNALWRGIYFAYLKAIVPMLGRIFAGSTAAYSYILDSLKSYPAQRGVASKMRELGLSEVRVFNLLGGIMSIHYGEKAGSPSSD